jgi:RNA polymerase sigma-70 factor (ECF subfamily)
MAQTPGSEASRAAVTDEAARRTVLQAEDAAVFGQLVEPYRRELQAHCYRMLGSLHEAEDQVQETMLRAWRRRDTYAGRASLRAWLYKIATNACLDVLDRRRARRWLPQSRGAAADPAAPLAPPGETPWLEPYPDEALPDAEANPEARYSQRESVRLAFLAALQSLPPRQRAALILSDVLDWPAREVADLLEVTPGAASSALHRARTALARTEHRSDARWTTAGQADPATRELLERYVQAWETADVRGLVALLREDAVLSMPPAVAWYQGREAVGDFVSRTVLADGGMFGGAARGRWRLLLCAANGEAGFGLYQRSAEGRIRPFGVSVVSLAGGGPKVTEITVFLDPRLPARFGLPHELGQGGPAGGVPA